MDIANVTRNELYEIATFLDNCWKSEYSDIIDADFLCDMSVSERHKMLLNRFDGNISEFLVMRRNGKLIGAAVFGTSFTDEYLCDGEISAIYLDRDFIGKGYGHALFARIEDILLKKGYKNFVLDVLAENVRAINFYIAHGYQKVDERFIKLGKKEYPLIVFRKSI